MSWLNDWDDAAKHPKRALAFMLLAGLAGGGLVGYFRFDRSPAWAAILGVTFAAILTYIGWGLLRDPAWAQRRRSRKGFNQAMLGLAMPVAALVLALIVGAAAHSERVFITVSAVGLALSFVLRFTLWR